MTTENRSRYIISSTIIEKFEDAISEEMLAGAAELFSKNHGVWGPKAAKNMGPFTEAGK